MFHGDLPQTRALSICPRVGRMFNSRTEDCQAGAQAFGQLLSAAMREGAGGRAATVVVRNGRRGLHHLSRLRERSYRIEDAIRVRVLSSWGAPLRRHPLPSPLPQAGEGAQLRCRYSERPTAPGSPWPSPRR
ncbi:hypothetical protein NK6_7288 [Bradyrhizobium diazoefficiens]|uniref:Uncharacterized protein n=1 Tax=Bradyrhizobium diazoefficiens TaxID=1355477 RepID=A0A0E4BTK9_9BRAD|nr:hypothetical protein NK6_7288 [Bradyrhizobium diazoefficiens]